MAYNILIMGGASRFTKYWAQDLGKELDRHFQNTRVLNYEHWNDYTPELFEVANEIHELSERAKDMNPVGIVAYGEGIAVALRAIREQKIKPYFFVFIGFPYLWANARNLDDELRSWMHGLQLPSLYIQNEKDPNCRADYLREWLQHSVKNYKLEIQYGKYDSYYDNLYELSSKIQEFAKGLPEPTNTN